MSSSSQERALRLPVGWQETRPRAVGDGLEREPTDEEVFSRLQLGDESALEVLLDRYYRLVLDIALHVLHDRGEAEGVVQEVFFFVFRRAKVFDASKGTAKSWIVQAAYHRSLTRRTYLRRRGFFAGTEIGSLRDTLAGDTDLEREIGAKLSRAQLQKAFEELPEMQRRTLELYYFEGLELREIGEKLEEPLGNVRHHYYRGMQRLRKSAIVRKMHGK